MEAVYASNNFADLADLQLKGGRIQIFLHLSPANQSDFSTMWPRSRIVRILLREILKLRALLQFRSDFLRLFERCVVWQPCFLGVHIWRNHRAATIQDENVRKPHPLIFGD